MKKFSRVTFLLSLLFFIGEVEQSFADKSKVNSAYSGKNAQKTAQEDERAIILKRIAKLKVDYVSPASGIVKDFRKEYLRDIRKFGIIIPDEAFIDKNIYRFSDTDDNRFIRLERSINSNSDIIWAMRGGFGSYKLIDRLANIPQPKKKKILIGFSDITALNLYVSQNWKNWTVIHAPMIVHTAKDDYFHESWSVLLDILEHRVKQYEISGLFPLNNSNKVAKKITGELTGGNLTLIESSLKTNWEIDTDNKILFIEDCNETAPSVYRSLHHLKVAGKLKKVKAIIFGEFFGVKGCKKYLQYFASEMDIPMFVTDNFGHGKKNFPLVYGAKASIENNSLIVDLSEKL